MDTTFYLILASIAIILVIIVYAYYTFIKPRVEAQYVNNKEFIGINDAEEGGREEEVVIILKIFH